jgi:hypothetical protein
MSQPHGRDDPATGPQPHGSTAYGGSAFSGRPLPGQPGGEQHTEQLPPVWPGHTPPVDTGPDTVVGMPAAARYQPPPLAPPSAPQQAARPVPQQAAHQAPGQRPSSFWDGDAADHHRDEQRSAGWAPPPPAEASYDTGRPTGPIAVGTADPDATAPAWSDRPVAVRRPDTLAGLLLLLAGIAAGVSLLVVWVHGGGTGLDLVRDGIDDARQGTDRLTDTGTWQPLAVVLGGAVLFLIGLFLFTPARTHRFLGGLAVVVTLGVAAGVLVPLADAGWAFDRFTTGFWFAIAVGVLGLLGGLKALMTGPKVR